MSTCAVAALAQIKRSARHERDDDVASLLNTNVTLSATEL